MKVLILGCNGQLGRCLADQLKNTTYDVIYSSRDQIDISNLSETKNTINKIAPDLVINASAYTAVDKAEEEQIKADLINHLAVANISKICSKLGSWLIHFSTDYVFDGGAKTPYKEDDKTNPQSVYGKSKLQGELAIEQSGCKHIIIRTSWVFSEYGNNFMKTMLNLGASHEKLNIVGDQTGCPTYAQDIAKIIPNILISISLGKAISGIFHFCGDQSCSWHDFAKFIFSEASILGKKTPNSINSIKTEDYPTLAIRPIYSELDCSKIKKIFDINTSDWQKGVRNILNQ